MDSEFREKAKRCCHREYSKVMERLDRCDSRSGERHSCYRDVARKSGMAARDCIAEIS